MWTCDPPMGLFQFLYTAAECQPDGQVKFSEAGLFLMRQVLLGGARGTQDLNARLGVGWLVQLLGCYFFF
jgi:hypothetical protein